MAVVENELKEAIRNSLSYEELLETMLKDLCADELKLLSDTLKKNTASELVNKEDEDFASSINEGESFTHKERAKLELASLMRFFRRRHELLEDAIRPSEVAQLLNTTRQTPHDRRTSGSLLAIQDNGVWKFPTWQFDPQGPNGVVAGLPEVLKVLRISDFAKLNWLTAENAVLQTTPIAALKAGRKQQVLAEAVAVGVI